MTISYRFLDDSCDVANYFEVRAPKAAGDKYANPGASTSIVRRNPALTHNEYVEDREAVTAFFGLPTPWAQDGDGEYAPRYFARIESAWEKPAFRSLWEKKQRCIVPVQHFSMVDNCAYNDGQWRRVTGPDAVPMGLAGLWSAASTPAGVTKFTFAILTTSAERQPLISRFYAFDDKNKRMPVILTPDKYEVWLSDAPDEELDFVYQRPRLPLRATPAFAKCRDQCL